MTSNQTSPSRLTRFRQIMEAAAGASTATYEGYGRFWNLPLSELRDVVLYGIPMMRGGDAPPPQAKPASSCCHEHGDAEPPLVKSDGSQSGLVRGLRGQFPFDGTQFPRLPWGGSPVAQADIAFIAQWIADGCPGPEEDERESSGEERKAKKHALATGVAAHVEHAGSVNDFLDDAGSLKQRKNVTCLTPQELQALRAALAQMKSLDAYYQDERSFGYWARIHANQCQHGWEEFLTWHRAYLYEFELQLQDIDPSVTLPYWDWAAEAANVQASLEDMGAATNDNGVVPEPYRCWIDEAGLARLNSSGKVQPNTIVALRAIIGKTFSSGSRLFAAAGIAYGADPIGDQAIIAELGAINPLWTWRRWPGGNKNIIFEAYPTSDDVDRILTISNFFSFGSGPMNDEFFGALENIHNLIHNFSGGINPNATLPGEPATGDMVNAGTTAFDPIFWGHHSNVDRIWATWQQRHPGAGPDNPASPLPPWSLTVSDIASTHALGYEYVMNSHLFPTDPTTPIQRFRSAAVNVAQHVLAVHQRAEIRLHGIQYVTRAGFHIRAFLNAPDANAQTPTTGNDHYVGQVNMFTGLCIGGPGHCEPPQRRPNRFDLRPRPHKAPSNFRFDATEAIRKLAAAGAKDFQVNLVVLNTDGTPAHDALRIDAVSLNFIA